MQYVVCLVFGYLVGSVPTAYLLVKWNTNVDIRKAGSGKVGAMNTFEVSGSRMLGTSVLVIDLLKGIAAVWVSSLTFDREFWTMGSAGLGSIAGHNYSPWLKFKGGRGLATALGVSLAMGWIFVVVWCGSWVIVYAVSKDIHISNITASIIGPVILVVLPERYWQVTLPSFSNSTDFRYLIIFMCMLIVIRHHDYIVILRDTLTNTKS